ncbi:hypothetical protein Ahy_A07g037252 isoform E [Arachis hypogaea]|uniref:Uncharacterized protein n=1 Tax=Arachis hypogaea TaxID=3818 RepID=A0A445CI68_ARAHY|nr:hypothetical protein Ahy_A07g037252 isoform E [Arachis hypogaea]
MGLGGQQRQSRRRGCHFRPRSRREPCVGRGQRKNCMANQHKQQGCCCL